MILIKTNYILLGFLIVFLNSCESFKRVAGLEKPVIDDSIIQETPDLILPPDFEQNPVNENINSYKQNDNDETNNIYIDIPTNTKNYIMPETKNFIAPNFSTPTAKSPSESIEKFKRNNNFSLGEWVFKQSLNDFKFGNLYYQPIYDKGYNFSRRYTPNPSRHQNSDSKLLYNDNKNFSFEGLQLDKDIEMSGEIPILD